MIVYEAFQWLLFKKKVKLKEEISALNNKSYIINE